MKRPGGQRGELPRRVGREGAAAGGEGELLLSSRRVFVHRPRAPQERSLLLPTAKVTSGEGSDEAEGSWH